MRYVFGKGNGVFMTSFPEKIEKEARNAAPELGVRNGSRKGKFQIGL